jgi:probable HAF family extracellular repeat protein
MNNFRQAFFVFLALSIPAGLPAEYLFTVTDLGTLGGTTSSATGINAWGQVVGTSTTSYGVSRAFVYWHGVMIDLGTLGGDYSSATAINNVGQIVGVATTSTGDQHAFLFQGSTMTDLGTLGGNTSQANAINDHGQIVGSSTLANGQTRAFLYDHGAMTNLGALGDGAQSSIASGINNNGEIIGNSDNGPPAPFVGNFPFAFTNGQMSVLSGFESYTADAEYGVTAINNSGQTVGGGRFSSLEEASSGFIDTAGNVTLFGLPQADPSSPGPYAYAYAINDYGMAVGETYSNTYRNGAYQAMIYYQGLTGDLNVFVNLAGTDFTNLDHAYGINIAGQIVGSGLTKDGSSHAYLLTPIPAPSP